MSVFIIRRILNALITIAVVSVVSFTIIQLPPGDFLTSYAANLRAQGDTVAPQQLEALRESYGLGQPFHVQYFKWVGKALRGDFGQSLEWQQPVNKIIWNRLAFSIMVSLLSILFVWAVAIPIGVYVATHQYSLGDYFFTFLGLYWFGHSRFYAGTNHDVDWLFSLWARCRRAFFTRISKCALEPS